MKNIFEILCITSILFLGSSQVIAAQTTQEIFIGKEQDNLNNIEIHLSGEPSETLTEKLAITNLTENTLNIKTDISNTILSSGNQISPIMETADSNWIIDLWIEISEEDRFFSIEPNETKEIVYVIKIPTESKPGEHYASILLTPVTTENDVNKPLINYKLGTSIILTTSGELRESVEITDFTTPYFSEYGPISLNLRYQNTGNTQISTGGKVSIINTWGKKIAEWKIQQAQTFPTNIRTWNMELKDKLRFGVFKAQFELNYGSENKTLTTTTYFWILPWRILLLTGFLSIILSLILHNKKNPLVKTQTSTVVEKEKTKSRLSQLGKKSVKEKLNEEIP